MPSYRILKATLLTMLLTLPLAAQLLTGSLGGSVEDPSQAPVPGATVVLTNVATAFQRQLQTNAAGEFEFQSLENGEYALAVTKHGFKRIEKRNLVLDAGGRLSAGVIRLELGQVSDTVTVQAQATVVQSESGDRSGVISGSQVDTLAIRGRNIMSLMQLLPGVVDTGTPDALSETWTFNALGNRTNTSNVTVDGATMNAIGNNSNGVVTLGMDAVAEVHVLLSNYDAAYGRKAGANVYLVSKSGTTEFHGLGSYFKRHEEFNANSFFNNQAGIAKPRYRYNTWNYNIGGPAYIPKVFNRNKQKLFFFWSWEHWPDQYSTALTQLTVPTALEREGNFSQSTNGTARVTIKDPYNNGTPFAGNIIPTSRLNPSGLSLLSVFPMPNFSNTAVSRGQYNYIFEAPVNSPTTTETLKIDYNVTASDLITVNFTHTAVETDGAVASGTVSNWPRINQSNLNNGHVLILQYRKILTPTLISETSVSYSWRPWNVIPDAADVKANQRTTVGYTAGQFNPSLNPLDLIPQATFGGLPKPANLTMDGRFPLTTGHDIAVLSTNLSKVVSAHTLKAGFYADRVGAYNQIGVPYNGLFDFNSTNGNNPLNTGDPYSNADLGVFNSYTEPSANPFPTAIAHNVEWFLQDHWKITRRLTLDFGMRFSLVNPAYVTGNQLSNFLPSSFNLSQAVKLIQPVLVNGVRMGVNPVTGTTYPATYIGGLIPGVGNPDNGMVVAATDKNVPPALIDNRGIQWGPRFGFALDVFGNGKTALRGGFGAFYDRIQQTNLLYPYAQQFPIVQSPIIYYGNISTLLSSNGVLFPSAVQAIDQSGKVPMVMNFSVGIQQAIGFGTVVDVSYVGSVARHLPWQQNLNAIPYGTDFLPASIDPTTKTALASSFLRPYIGYNDISYEGFASTSNYHSMQMSVNRRFAHHIQFGGSWTWSKAMDFTDTDTGVVSTFLPVRIWNYGLAGFDRTHVVKLNWLYDLPGVKWKNPAIKKVLNDWHVSGIASFISGAPAGVSYSLTYATDLSGSPTESTRVDVTGNPELPKSQRTFYRYFNTSVFEPPAIGTPGDAARTLFRGPGINNFDLSLLKDFYIYERLHFQFRTEAYNAFNHTQFSTVNAGAQFNPSGQQVNALFGQVTAARDPRIVQLGLRLYF